MGSLPTVTRTVPPVRAICATRPCRTLGPAGVASMADRSTAHGSTTTAAGPVAREGLVETAPPGVTISVTPPLWWAEPAKKFVPTKAATKVEAGMRMRSAAVPDG